ncbi:hypothetical protein AB4254_09055 [Vibrio breoganii]
MNNNDDFNQKRQLVAEIESMVDAKLDKDSQGRIGAGSLEKYEDMLASLKKYSDLGMNVKYPHGSPKMYELSNHVCDLETSYELGFSLTCNFDGDVVEFALSTADDVLVSKASVSLKDKVVRVKYDDGEPEHESESNMNLVSLDYEYVGECINEEIFDESGLLETLAERYFYFKEEHDVEPDHLYVRERGAYYDVSKIPDTMVLTATDVKNLNNAIFNTDEVSAFVDEFVARREARLAKQGASVSLDA